MNGNGGCAGTGCPAASQTTETEGIFTGYRFFDKEGITPQFSFGYGLSYTKFAFSSLGVKSAGDGGVDVSFSVKNTGSVAGADAAQVYVGPPTDSPAGIQFAVRSLAQFDRVSLAPGQSQTVTLHVPPRELSYWSETAQQWVLDSGGRTIWVGDADAAASLPLSATLRSANPNITCSNEQFNATTINGNLTVPQGTWCDLVDVTVKGNVQVQQSSGVRIQDATIGGNLQVENSAAAADPLSADTNVICNSTITGNVQVHNSGSGVPWNIGGCGANTIKNNLQFNNNPANGNTIANNTVQGNLQCQNNGTLSGTGNNVKGKNQCPGVS